MPSFVGGFRAGALGAMNIRGTLIPSEAVRQKLRAADTQTNREREREIYSQTALKPTLTDPRTCPCTRTLMHLPTRRRTPAQPCAQVRRHPHNPTTPPNHSHSARLRGFALRFRVPNHGDAPSNVCIHAFVCVWARVLRACFFVYAYVYVNLTCMCLCMRASMYDP